MCIRDRKYNYSIMEISTKVQEKVKNAVENMTGLEAVSYTHLDVYKRQGCMTVYAAEDTVDYDAVESGAESKLFSEFDFSEIDNSLQKMCIRDSGMGRF